jgi:hypothetical protein
MKEQRRHLIWRLTHLNAKRTPPDLDCSFERFEDDGGPGPEDTRNRRRDAPPGVAEPEVKPTIN